MRVQPSRGPRLAIPSPQAEGRAARPRVVVGMAMMEKTGQSNKEQAEEETSKMWSVAAGSRRRTNKNRQRPYPRQDLAITTQALITKF